MLTGQMGGVGTRKKIDRVTQNAENLGSPKVEREKRHSTNNKYLLSASYVPGQNPQAVCPAVFTSPGHRALIYLGLENVVRHLDTHWVPAQNQHWMGRREAGRVLSLSGPPLFYCVHRRPDGLQELFSWAVHSSRVAFKNLALKLE